MEWVTSGVLLGVRVTLLIFFVAVFIFYYIPRPSSFSVAAKTEFLRAEVSDINQPDWFLPKVTACVRLDGSVQEDEEADTVVSENSSEAIETYPDVEEEKAEVNKNEKLCGEGFAEYKVNDGFVKFAPGYTLVFRGFKPGVIEVAVRQRQNPKKDETETEDSGNEETSSNTAAIEVRIDGYDDEDGPVSEVLTSGSTLIIPFDATDRPDIAMRGFVDLGERPTASGGLLLRSADYEVRQEIWSTTYVVLKGQFLLGDKVNFVRHPRAQIGCKSSAAESAEDESETAEDEVENTEIAANIVISSDRRFAAFDVILTTPKACSGILITRTGATPTALPIPWTARVASDPNPAAAATLIGLLGALIGLSNAYLTPRGSGAKSPNIVVRSRYRSPSARRAMRWGRSRHRD